MIKNIHHEETLMKNKYFLKRLVKCHLKYQPDLLSLLAADVEFGHLQMPPSQTSSIKAI